MEDQFITKREDGIDRLKPEVFENVKEIILHTPSCTVTFSDEKVDEVTESFNYFTAHYRNNKELFVVKYSDVLKMQIMFYDG